MNRYQILCTTEQTIQAIKLGAPIKYVLIGPIGRDIKKYLEPTAEEIIGWLEEQGIAIDIHTYFMVGNDKIRHYQYTVTDSNRVFNGVFTSRREAILSAIGTAFEYLENVKQ